MASVDDYICRGGVCILALAVGFADYVGGSACSDSGTGGLSTHKTYYFGYALASEQISTREVSQDS
jgi:hypothetical protein